MAGTFKRTKLLAEQLENEEIIKTIRSMKLDSHQMLELLEGIQDGTVSIPIMAEGPEETDGKDGIEPGRRYGRKGAGDSAGK